jgi:raffinose/stachyose/melibiose transport system substrate-binding protein
VTMKRYSLLFSVLAVLMLLLSACGNGSSNNNGKVVINWWHISTTDPLKTTFQNLANQYMKDHPNVQIKITIIENQAFKTKLATAMQAGTPPDIFQSWGGGTLQQYAQAGLLKDITSDLQQGGWGDSFGKAGIDLYSYNGHTYGVPWDLGAVGFWYNKALFAQAHITQTPATWDDLLNDVKTLKAAGITPLALGEKDEWPGAFYWEYLAARLGGKAAFDKAYSHKGGSFTDAPFVQAGQYLQQLVSLQPFQNGFLAAAYGDHQAIMGNGKAAMELMGQWAPASDAANATDKKGPEFGFFPFPAIPGGAGNPTDVLGGGNGFALGKDAPPEAVDFVRFLTNVDNESTYAKQGAALPPVKAAQAAVTDPNLQAVAQLVANAPYYQLYYDQYMAPAVGQAVNDQTAALFAGKTTPQAVAQAIDAAATSGG